MLRAYLAIFLVLAVSHQEGWTAPQQEIPVFKTEVHYIEVDTIVIGPGGDFVGELDRDDFEILEDGVPQSIADFRFVDLQQEHRPATVTGLELVTRDVRTNETADDGRLYVLVLDDLHTSPERSSHVRRVARGFIEKWIIEGDLVAVAHTSGRTDISREFTDDRRALVTAVNGFMGRKLPSMTFEKIELRRQLTDGVLDEVMVAARLRSLDQEHGSRARETLSSLRAITRALTTIRGRKKSIVFISEGINYDIYDFVNSSQSDMVMDETRALLGSAGLANVSIYALDVRGLGAGQDELVLIPDMPRAGDIQTSEPGRRTSAAREVQDLLDETNLGSLSLAEEARRSHAGLRILSSETGGFAVINENDLEEGLGRIAIDNSHYYLLGYYPTHAEADGRFRRIEVRVKRSDVTVRARRGYVIPEADSRSTDRGGHVPHVPDDPLGQILRNPIPMPGLPLRVFAAPFLPDEERVSVAILVEADIEGFGFTEQDGKHQDTLDLTIMAIGSNGELAERSNKKFNLSLRPRVQEQMLQDGFRVLSVLELPPDFYQLRIGALESGAAQTGSVFYDVEVSDREASNLVTSGLFLSSAKEEAIPIAATQKDRESIPFHPSARRKFTSQDEILTYVEVQGAASRPKKSNLTVETVVLDSAGKTVFESKEGHDDSPFLVRNRIDLARFAPGRYVLAVRVQDLDDNARVERKTAFEVIESPVVSDLVPREPGETLPYFELLNLYRSGRFEEARSQLVPWKDNDLKRAVQELKNTADAPMIKVAILLHTEVMAYDAWKLNEKTRANHIKTAEDLLSFIPDRPDRRTFERDWLLAMAYYYHGEDLFESMAYLNKAMKAFPDDAAILLAAGATEEASVWIDGERGRLKDAEKFYRRAIRADPELVMTHLRLGRILCQRGDKFEQEAFQELNEVVDYSRDPYLLYLANLFLGDLHKTHGRTADAVSSYEAAVRAEPKWQIAYMSLSQALLAQGNRLQARDVAREALSLPVLGPDYLDGYRLYRLGLLSELPAMLQRMRQEIAK